ncbi:MAG: FAD-linked oxidase C-terminal domain-containing protein [Pseudomonadota bacterium]
MKIKNFLSKIPEHLRKDSLVNESELKEYSKDESSGYDKGFLPELVLFPKNKEDVSAILKNANELKIPVTARGGGTGLCGSALPLKGGIVLSFSKMNKILEIDTENLMAKIEAGVTLEAFSKEIEKANLFFPPHPGEENAQFGGLIATNAGGARAVKYGIVRNYVKGMTCVLANGKIIKLGGKLVKSSSGYNLLNLVIGSEGTLCIVTNITIALLPKPKEMLTLIIPFENIHSALNIVPKIRAQVMPMAIEFLEKDVIQKCELMLNKTWPCKGQAFLMIILDGNSEELLFAEAEKINNLCSENNKLIDNTVIADTEKRRKDVLALRSNLYLAIKKETLEPLDITVPPSQVSAYLQAVQAISEKHDIWLPSYGHAGDGNIHTHITKKNRSIKTNHKLNSMKIYTIKAELHQIAKDMSGIVSGEHGIGLAKKEYLPMFLEKEQIDLMKEIKKAFDPNTILNPGKIF